MAALAAPAIQTSAPTPKPNSGSSPAWSFGFTFFSIPLHARRCWSFEYHLLRTNRYVPLRSRLDLCTPHDETLFQKTATFQHASQCSFSTTAGKTTRQQTTHSHIPSMARRNNSTFHRSACRTAVYFFGDVRRCPSLDHPTSPQERRTTFVLVSHATDRATHCPTVQTPHLALSAPLCPRMYFRAPCAACPSRS